MQDLIFNFWNFSDNVNVHIGDVTIGYGGDLDDDVDDNFEDELDEDALLDADFDEDVVDDPDFEDEELRSWRRWKHTTNGWYCSAKVTWVSGILVWKPEENAPFSNTFLT